MKSNKWILWLLFALTLAIRLKFAFSVPHFSSDTSYFVLRQVEHITATGLPLFQDTLSYSGRVLIFNPLYMYILALFNLFLPLSLVAKLLPNIFISSMVFLIYFIMRDTTKNNKVALFGAVVSTVIPILYGETLNDASVYSLVIPLTLLVLYYFIKIREDVRYGVYCSIVLVALALMHPSSVLVPITFIIYYLFLKLEGLSCTKAEREVIIFGTLAVLFVQMIIFRNSFLLHGTGVILQNIPRALLSNFFKDITLPQAIYQIGIIPLLYGVYMIYRYLFREKDFTIYFYISFAISTTLLLWFKLITINSGLIFLGTILLLLFTQRFKLFLDYIKRTKFAKFESAILFGMLISFLLTSLIPALALADTTTKNSLQSYEVDAFTWLEENSLSDEKVLASVEEGHVITYYSRRMNVMDSNFLLINNINQLYEDVSSIYTTFSQTEA
ncbi:MAG: glycosyltransferase family 39 protein, partial [Candidatus Woesearchaeota archaeon]|nr:glycosyltransferase family 39 protein [Candidatus Woesearchaeota archaeon]